MAMIQFTCTSQIKLEQKKSPVQHTKPARKFHGKGIKLKNFPLQPLWCSGTVQACRTRSAGFESYSITCLFFSFFELLVSIKTYLNDRYLIKCNKQQDKYRVPGGKIVHRILNIWINNLNFFHFLQFTVGKPELITI